jgi:hypothetical protein
VSLIDIPASFEAALAGDVEYERLYDVCSDTLNILKRVTVIFGSPKAW